MLTIKLGKRQEQLLTPPKPQSLPKPKKRRRRRVKHAKAKTVKCVGFRNTPLGDFLFRYCPLEYELIDDAKNSVNQRNKADFIESLAYRSDNVAFQTAEFRKCLSDFRKYRCKTPNVARFDLDTEIEAIRNRLKLKD